MPSATLKPLSNSKASRQSTAAKKLQTSTTQAGKKQKTKTNADKVQKSKDKTISKSISKAKSSKFSKLESVAEEVTYSLVSGSDFQFYHRATTPPTPTPSKVKSKVSSTLKEDKNAVNRTNPINRARPTEKENVPNKGKAGSTGVTCMPSEPEDNKENIDPDEFAPNYDPNPSIYMRIPPVSRSVQYTSANTTALISNDAKNTLKTKRGGKAKTVPNKVNTETTSKAAGRKSTASKTTTKAGVRKSNTKTKQSATATALKNATDHAREDVLEAIADAHADAKGDDELIFPPPSLNLAKKQRTSLPRAKSIASKIARMKEAGSESHPGSQSPESVVGVKDEVEVEGRPYKSVNYSATFGDMDVSEGESDDEKCFGAEFVASNCGKGRGKRVAHDDVSDQLEPFKNVKKPKLTHHKSDQEASSATPPTARKVLAAKPPSARMGKATSDPVEQAVQEKEQRVEGEVKAEATAAGVEVKVKAGAGDANVDFFHNFEEHINAELIAQDVPVKKEGVDQVRFEGDAQKNEGAQVEEVEVGEDVGVH